MRPKQRKNERIMFIGCWKQIELKLSAEFKKLKESYRRGLVSNLTELAQKLKRVFNF